MPDITQVSLTDWCVVWLKSDEKNRRGLPRVQSPIEVRCRWVYEDRLNSSLDRTIESFPRSIQVGRNVPVGSIVWGEGRQSELDLTVCPYLEVSALQVIPDFTGRHPSYRITLVKASNTLPEIVSS